MTKEAPPPRLRGRSRLLCLQIAAEARAEWAYTSEVISRAFRTERSLGSSDRRIIAETVYGLVRWHRRLEAIGEQLMRAARRKPEELSGETRDELLLLIYEARQGADPVAIAAEAGPLLRSTGALERLREHLVDEDAGLGNSQGADRDALRLSFPTWLYERFVNDLGVQEAEALCVGFNKRAPLCVRVNTVKIEREALRTRLAGEGVTAHPTTLSNDGLIFDTRINAFGLPSFQEGLFEVMDEGSQLVAEAVAPPPRGRVADACAGAGGKTLALAAQLQGAGRVLALDVAGKKLEELRRRARRAGLSNVLARPIEEGKPWPAEAKAAAWDRVLIDAPCSGLGTLRRNPEARWRLSPKAVDVFPARQLALMVEYAPLVEVGGRLIYATCSVLSSENERVIERFCAERPEFVPMPLKDIFGRERAEKMGDGHTLRLFPHRQDTDGFFAAVLRRLR
jgi:16S rRNA (cytosine967-C5)-methyltransferase